MRTLEQRFPQWFGVTLVHWPFLLNAEERPNFEILFLQPNARQAGLDERDVLIATNGVPVTSRSVYSDILLASHPGDMLDVTFRKKGKQLEEHARVRLEKLVGKTNLFSVLLFLVMPALCLGLGFWVVIVRPHDVRAWLLLALLLSIATLFNSFADFWSSSYRTLAIIYFQLGVNSLPG